MFKFVILAALVACAAAAPPSSSSSSHASSSDDVNAEVKMMTSDVRPDGFDYALETSNSIHQVASGDEHGNIHGSYEYVSPEGEHIKVSYVADENGYQPDSSILPTPPPVPEAILKAIEYIRAHPPKEETTKPHH